MKISELDSNFSLAAIPKDLEITYYDVKKTTIFVLRRSV